MWRASARGEIDEKAREIARAFEQAGIDAQTAPFAQTAWKRLVWNVPFNGVAVACGGLTSDQIMADAALMDLVRALMREVQLKNDLTNAKDDLSALEQQLAELLPEGLPAGN